MKKWYVIHTLPKGEEIAVVNLQRQGFEVFLPRYHKARRHARKTDVVLAPLFPRYLFINLDLEYEQWFPVNSTRGVAYLVRQTGCPLAVPEGVIEELKQRADHQEIVPLSSLELFKVGEHLEILEGAFVGHTGRYEKMTADERVQLLLTMLGRDTRIAMPVHAVAAVA